jgi:hypothetical protein
VLRRLEGVDGIGHRWRVVQRRERIAPRAIDPQMLFDILDQVPDTFARVIARTFILDIPTGPLNGISLGTVGRSVQPRKAGMGSEPRLHFLSFMQLRVIDHDGELRKEWRGMRLIERIEQLKKQPGLFAIPDTLRDPPGGDVQGPRQIALLIGPGGHHLDLFPFGHPLGADFR